MGRRMLSNRQPCKTLFRQVYTQPQPCWYTVTQWSNSSSGSSVVPLPWTISIPRWPRICSIVTQTDRCGVCIAAQRLQQSGNSADDDALWEWCHFKFKIACITYKTVSTAQPAYIHSVYWNNTFRLVDFVHQTVVCRLSHVSAHALHS